MSLHARLGEACNEERVDLCLWRTDGFRFFSPQLHGATGEALRMDEWNGSNIPLEVQWNTRELVIPSCQSASYKLQVDVLEVQAIL